LAQFQQQPHADFSKAACEKEANNEGKGKGQTTRHTQQTPHEHMNHFIANKMRESRSRTVNTNSTQQTQHRQQNDKKSFKNSQHNLRTTSKTSHHTK
jgi:hypothetical protein